MPTALLRASGAGNDKRRENHMQEPQVARIVGDCKIPPSVEKIFEEYPKALEQWEIVTKQLDRMGVFGTIDAHEISRYCIIFAKWHICEEKLILHGQTYEHRNSSGEVTLRRRPEADLAAKYSDQMQKIEVQFGMTASARASVDLSQTQHPDVNTPDKYRSSDAG